MKPLKDLVLVRVNIPQKETKNDNGMLIAAPRWGKPENTCEVLAIGPLATQTEVGKKYIINPYAAIETSEKDVQLIKERDILCELEA